MTLSRRPYATDLTDAEWQLLAPLIPAPKPGGRPAVHDRRELVNAMAYRLRAGCAWRLLPHDLPNFAPDGSQRPAQMQLSHGGGLLGTLTEALSWGAMGPGMREGVGALTGVQWQTPGLGEGVSCLLDIARTSRRSCS